MTLDTDTTYSWTIALGGDAVENHVAPAAYVTQNGALVIGELDDDNACNAPLMLYAHGCWASCTRGSELMLLRDSETAS